MRSATGGLRRNFVQQIESACRELGLSVEWSADWWIARVVGGRRSTKIIGYTFELNDAASAEAAVDKVCTFQILDDAGIPAIKHHLFEIPDEPTDWRERLPADFRPPLVIKPHRGSGGADVLLSETRAQLLANLELLAAKYRIIAYSPYVRVATEYRAVVLDDRVRLLFRKVRPPGNASEWRFNLNLGAQPEVVVGSEPDYHTVSDLARRAARAVGIRFGAVDIVVSSGSEVVMEVNDAFSLVHFSACSAVHFQAAYLVYLLALSSIFDGDPLT